VELAELVELVELVQAVEIDGEAENLRAVVSLMIPHRPVKSTAALNKSRPVASLMSSWMMPQPFARTSCPRSRREVHEAQRVPTLEAM
jgi:hypothetical protein